MSGKSQRQRMIGGWLREHKVGSQEELVGRLALTVIEEGDITAEAVSHLPGAKVTEYVTPEATREIQRKDSTEAVKIQARQLLNEIRTGGLSR